MKTAEELNALREEVKTLNKKLAELTKEELEQVTGGVSIDILHKDFCFSGCVLEPPVLELPSPSEDRPWVAGEPHS